MTLPGNRRDQRFDAAWRVQITAGQWADVLQLTTSNVSSGGVFVAADDPLAQGTRIGISVTLPDGSALDVEGQVVHVLSPDDARAEGKPPGFGIRFDAKYATDVALIEAMAAGRSGGEHAYALNQDLRALPAIVTRNMSLGSGLTRTLLDHSLRMPEAVGRDLDVDEDDTDADDMILDTPEDHIVPRNGPEANEPSDQLAASPLPEPRDAPIVDIAEGPSDGLEVGPVFGIDFGTSFAAIAVVDGNRIRILSDQEGHTLTPAVVSFPERSRAVVGWAAREGIVTLPSTTFVSPKRLLGRRFDDARIKPLVGALAVRTQESHDGLIAAEIFGSAVSVVEICAEILKRIAEIGEQATGVPVRRVLLSAPVGCDQERAGLVAAAKLAGLRVLGFVDEPVAAAIGCGLQDRDDHTVAVYDLGGGTFDFTVIRVREGRLSVVGKAGDPWLGGDDFDTALANYAADSFQRRYKVDLRQQKPAWQRLLFHCEAAKRRLSTQQETDLVVRSVVLSIRGGIDLNAHFDRQLMDELCGHLVDRTIGVVCECLSQLNLAPHDMTKLVLAGGMSRVPMIRERVATFFNQQPRMTVTPEHAIALGNAVYGRFIEIMGHAPNVDMSEKQMG